MLSADAAIGSGPVADPGVAMAGAVTLKQAGRRRRPRCPFPRSFIFSFSKGSLFSSKEALFSTSVFILEKKTIVIIIDNIAAIIISTGVNVAYLFKLSVLIPNNIRSRSSIVFIIIRTSSI